jgi:hypothetical protein
MAHSKGKECEMMLERLILKAGFVFGVLAFQTLLKKPAKLWLPLYLINGLMNHVFDHYLVTKRKVTYPTRFLPKVFKINFVYDYLVCSFLSVWYCQSTQHSKLKGLLWKLLLFSLPQGAYEIWLERKTKLMKFKGNWKWIYSLFLVVIVKLLSRGICAILIRSLRIKTSTSEK